MYSAQTHNNPVNIAAVCKIKLCQCLFMSDVYIYEGLPGLVKIFPSVSHSTGYTETLPQGASSYINKLLLL